MGQQNVNGSRVSAVKHLLYKIFTEYVISRIPDFTSLQRTEGNRLVVNSSWFASSRDHLCHGLGRGHGWRVMRVTGQLNDGSRNVTHCQLWAEWLEIAQWLQVTMESL